ncbi:MAG: glycosyltransferase, partial [Infirmifilum sp.]
MFDKISVIVPSTSLGRLGTLLRSFAYQSVKPHEVVIVVKSVEVDGVKKVCNALNLNCIVLEQRVGYFTHALNMGKDASTGDIVLFTDDDAIALPKWVERYVKLFEVYGSKVGCISSRD